MAQYLTADRTPTMIGELFYPTQDASPGRQTSSKRRAKFLTALNDQAYERVYRYILTNENRLQFPDVHRITTLSKEEGRVLF